MSNHKRKERKKIRRLKRKKKNTKFNNACVTIDTLPSSPHKFSPSNNNSCLICEFHEHYINCNQCKKTLSRKSGNTVLCICSPIFCRKYKKEISYTETFNEALRCEFYKELLPDEQLPAMSKEEIMEELTKELSPDICEECKKKSFQIYMKKEIDRGTQKNLNDISENPKEYINKCLYLALRVEAKERKNLRPGWKAEICFEHEDGLHVHIFCEHGDKAGDWIIHAPDHVRFEPTGKSYSETSYHGWLVDVAFPPIPSPPSPSSH